jgi:hypothetical protein
MSTWDTHLGTFTRKSAENHGSGRVPDGVQEGQNRFDEIKEDWVELRKQLLMQWPRLTGEEMEKAGMNYDRVANLIAHKQGIAATAVADYLHNVERHMASDLPAMAASFGARRPGSHER